MNRLLLSWMAVTSPGILLYGYSAAGFQARIILLAPLQVLGAMGFLSLLRYLTGLMGGGGNENGRLVKVFVALALHLGPGGHAGFYAAERRFPLHVAKHPEYS